MKYPTLIILLMLLSSCGQAVPLDSVVSISGYQGTREVIRGMGVCIGADTVLTSAHVVRDDRLVYDIGGTGGKIGERDFDADIAYMTIKSEEGRVKNICRDYRQYIGKTEALKIGSLVSIPVMRSGSLMTVTGAITSLTGTILAYDTIGRTQVLSGLILTDISLSPGDSGAPILDAQGRVIDVVHVAE